MFATEIAFQWLRPWWLLALIPAAMLMWMAWNMKAKQGAWHKVIDPQFQTLLLGRNPSDNFSLVHKLSLAGLATLWGLIIIILAGPSLKALEVPAQKTQKGTVIVLDLSLSMLADDLSPNRLERVKFKLTDLIQNHPQESIGLVAYAGTSHTITPISEDNQTLLSLLPSLNPLIMPAYGSNPLQGLIQAKQLFAGAHITDGHILWITDDIETEQMAAINDFFAANDYSLSILTVGTPQGGLIQIPNYGVLKDDQDQTVLAGLPTGRFVELSQALQAHLGALQIEVDDAKALLNLERIETANHQHQKEVKSILHPLDQGVALLLILVPAIALIYRRGWLFSFASTLLLPAGLLFMSSYSPPLLAQSDDNAWYKQTDELANMFQTHDQQAFKAWNKGNYAAAEALFENPQWRASALYELGRFAEAAKLYARDQTATGFYNQGNALAKAGQLEAAQHAYQQALKRDPQMRSAQKNLQIIEQLLAQQPDPQDNAIGDGQQAGQSQPNQSAEQDPAASQAESETGSEQTQPNTETSDANASPQEGNADAKSSANNSASSSSSKNAPQNETESSGLDQKNKQTIKEEIEQKLQANRSDPATPAGQKTQDSTDESRAPTQAENPLLGQENEGTSQANGLPNQQRKDSTAESNQPANAQQLVDSKDAQNDDQQTSAGALPNQLSEQNSEQTMPGPDDKQSAQSLEQTLATDTWIQQIPDSPSLFLKRKFEYQYNQRQTQDTPEGSTSQKTW